MNDTAQASRRRVPAPRTGSADPRPRLVFGDDGSPAADVTWLWIRNHRWPGWRISVLTARIRDAGPPVSSEHAAPHPWDPPYPRLLTDEAGLDVEHLLAESDPRLALDSCTDAALVAVGPRGRGVLKHLHVGSTTEWLVGAGRPLAPVVVVRSARPTHKVLVCVDGSEHARRAVTSLTRLPWIDDCQVGVLGVEDGTGASVPRAVDGAVTELLDHGVTAEPRVVRAASRSGLVDVRSVILSAIAESSPDLVAIGARGTRGLRGLLIGSVAAAVVHHAPGSVLVAPTA